MLTHSPEIRVLDDATFPRAPILSRRQQLQRVLDLTVELLIARTNIGDYWGDGFRETADRIDALPLATPEARSAKRRLQNAIGYCRQQEFGGAAFELRALRGLLLRL